MNGENYTRAVYMQEIPSYYIGDQEMWENDK